MPTNEATGMHSTKNSTSPPEILAAELEKCSRGEQKALKHIYQQTSAKLFAVILRILKDRQLAEDCLQQVYIKIWQAASSYNRGKAAPMTWMNTIARNQALDYLRKIQREPHMDTDTALDIQEDQGASQEQMVASSQDNREIHRCLKTLNENQKLCLELCYFDGQTHQSLSDQLEVPIGTVKTWIRRGLMRLKECMTV